jgi:hypothetical protein
MTARASFSDAIRAAAGRAAPAPAIEHEQPVGNIGIGRGGAAAPMRATTSNDDVNAAIRNAVKLARTCLVPGGVHLDQVDPDLLRGGR